MLQNLPDHITKMYQQCKAQVRCNLKGAQQQQCLHACRACLDTLQTYFLRWKGAGEKHPPPPPFYRVCATSSRQYKATPLLTYFSHFVCKVSDNAVLIADNACLAWLLPGSPVDRRNASVDQHNVVDTIVTIHLWASMCSGVWPTNTSGVSTH